MSFRINLPLVLLVIVSISCPADDPVFSGPQVGEALVPFQVVSVFGPDAGKEMDPLDGAAGKPTLLVFVHKLTRPGVALTRGLTAYAGAQPGVASGIIWLDDDRAKAEAYLNRARKSLNFSVPVGVSVDGGEGPGAYGLNRNVELTILIAKQNEVTANYALVQPSVTEGPEIAGQLARLIGKPAPTAEEFGKYAYPGGNRMARENMRRQSRATPQRSNELMTMMRKLVAAGGNESEVRQTVAEIEKWVGDDDARQQQLKRMSGAVLERGLGSPLAKEQLKRWQAQEDSDENESQE